MRKLLVAAVFIAALWFDLRSLPAYSQEPAREAPWCAVVSLGTGSVYWDCQYNSIEECRPNVIAGNRGFCNLNPRWSGWSNRAEAPRYRARPHYRRH
jgi:hypothetical protein